ncbi:MAG TPA: IS66 family transposase [Streptosporangiaceae bacterium]|nr:IS66 family transposase [Streptosporangiaceae bacterium]
MAAALRAERAGLTAQVAELAGQVARLQESVTTLSGLLSGSSSEKGGSPARGNRRGGDDGGAGGVRPGGKGKRGQRPGGRGHGRRDHSHLETGERFIDADAGQRCCAECGEPFEFLGTEDSEQTGWQVKITRIVWRRRRYRRRCSHPGPVTICAAPAARPVPKGLFTAGFLARLAYEKHVLGRPVHRIVEALAADGFDVASGTLVGALKQIAPLIAPWAEAIAAHGRQAGHVHADETSWQVFEDADGKDGHRWWLQVFVTDQATVFVMDTSRSADVAAGQLGTGREQPELEAGRRLVISSDFHKAYQSLARIDGVDPLWCQAHMRRYFLRAGAAHPDQLGDWADAQAERIAVLYRACHALAATTPGTEAHAHAQGRWQRAFTDIDAHRMLQSSDAGKGLLHPAAAKVIATLNNEWDGLARHRDLPQLPLDNNTAERALRTPVIGRENFYGSGAAWAAHLAAGVWTVTATAARHGIEPLGLLTAYLQACAEHGGTAPAGAGLDPFLPWTPRGRARRRPAGDQRQGPGP